MRSSETAAETYASSLAVAERRPGASASIAQRPPRAHVRSNVAIGKQLYISESAVEKHVRTIFQKLRLAPGEGDHRRVLAVLRYLEAARER